MSEPDQPPEFDLAEDAPEQLELLDEVEEVAAEDEPVDDEAPLPK